jgi:drug/metabolite transporter (DMT)-like permease
MGSRHEGIRPSLVQFAVCAVLSLTGAFLTEKVRLASVGDCLIPLLYTGILSSGAGYTIQIIGQKHLEPTLASLCMSMESVFGALGGWLILGQRLNGMEILGCLLMALAIVIAQLPEKK